MIVGHDVDAKLVAQRPFVEIAMVEIGADLRVEQPVGDDDPVGVAEMLPCRVIGHLAEMPDLHHVNSPDPLVVIPAKAGTQGNCLSASPCVPAFAGTTDLLV